MIALLGALLFALAAILTLLVGLGFPLGEFTMGGKYKVLPKPLRVMAFVSLLIQIFAIVMILQAGGYFPLWFSIKTTKTICLIFAVYLTLNSVVNFLSKSKKEKYVATPLSLLAGLFYWIIALS